MAGMGVEPGSCNCKFYGCSSHLCFLGTSQAFIFVLPFSLPFSFLVPNKTTLGLVAFKCNWIWLKHNILIDSGSHREEMIFPGDQPTDHMVLLLQPASNTWWIFLVWGLSSESWSMVHPLLLCCKCFNKGVSLIAYKASFTSRHIRKINFLYFALEKREGCCRPSALLCGLCCLWQRLWGFFVLILNCCLCCKFSGCVFPPQIRILGFRRAPLVVGRFVNLRTEIKPVATEQLLGTFMTVGKWIPGTVLPRKGKMITGKKEPWEPDTAKEQLTVMQKALSEPGEVLDNPLWWGGRTWFSSTSVPSCCCYRCDFYSLSKNFFLCCQGWLEKSVTWPEKNKVVFNVKRVAIWDNL